MTTATARLKYFPISWFAMVMGLAGFTIARGRAEGVFGRLAALVVMLLVRTGQAVLRRQIRVAGH